MIMKSLSLVLIFVSAFLSAQNSDEIQVKTAVNQLFEAMKEADSAKVVQAFSTNAVLQTITKNGEVKEETVKNFAASISKITKNDAVEKITFSNILIDGNLASVWTPYEFYYKGQFSHCGVNSFQLVKSNNEWKIQYIIDTRRKDNCKK